MTVTVSYQRITGLMFLAAVASAAVTETFFQKTKTVEVQKDVIHNNVVTVTHTVKLPSGEIDSTTTTTDHTSRVETDNKSAPALSPNWLVSGFVATDSISALANPAYGVQVNRRILGPIFIGASLSTKHDVGISLGMEF